jgi:hypothetical protein
MDNSGSLFWNKFLSSEWIVDKKEFVNFAAAYEYSFQAIIREDVTPRRTFRMTDQALEKMRRLVMAKLIFEHVAGTKLSIDVVYSVVYIYVYCL